MKIRLIITAFLALWIAILFSSCQKDNGVSYSDVKIIIDVSCAVSGCHNSSSKAGNLDCSTYAGLQSVLDNGKFTNRVLVQKDMPPAGTLSVASFEKLETWKDNNYKE